VLPRIGLTGSIVPTRMGTRRTFLNEPYVVAVQEAGGLPLVATPAHAGASLRELYELLDGLLLTGGEDVAPERYGEAVAYPSVESVPERDALEFTLLEWALADRLPVFAICRGLQLLNVALGGSLYQDLPSDRPGHSHDQMKAEPPWPRTEPHHRVTITPGSFLGDLVGALETE
jgi:putative glutamine amidotransferase